MKNDCFAPTAGLISATVAWKQLQASAHCLVDTEQVSLTEAGGRVLAAAVISEVDVPPRANAAVDGYAVNHADLLPGAQTRLPVSMRIAAGARPGALPPGTAAHILTGAPLPDGADTVVMQEDVEVEVKDEGKDEGKVKGKGKGKDKDKDKDKDKGKGDHVVFAAGTRQGINWRPAGEDVSAGSEVLAAGCKLRAADIGLAASLGVGEIQVYKPLEIAVFSTGDEIIAPGNEPEPGKRYDANAPLLSTFLRGQGHRVTNLGVLPDDPEKVAAALSHAARLFQVIISSGGASTGAADYVISTVQQLGAIDLWRLAIKPGRPFAFGRVATTPFIGLPGNPVAVGVCSMMFVTPYLNVLAGQSWQLPRSYPLPAHFDMHKKPGRTEWLRCRLVETVSGVAVDRHARQGSGVLSSLVEADGLVELTEDCETIRKGDMVSFIPIDQF